jgi:hypothetical protein
MDRVPVKSSNIREVGYDQESNILEILFVDGGLYHYFDVPPTVYDGILGATSPGKYFHANVLKVYRCERI